VLPARTGGANEVLDDLALVNEEIAGFHRGSGRRHENPASLTRARLLPDRDLDVAIEGGQKRHKALNGKPFELVTSERGDLWLRYAKAGRGFALAQAFRGDCLVDGISKPQPGLALVRVRVAQVGEYIAGPASDCLVRRIRAMRVSTCHN